MSFLEKITQRKDENVFSPLLNYHLKIALKNAGNEPGKLRVAFKINSGNKSSFYKIIQIVRAL